MAELTPAQVSEEYNESLIEEILLALFLLRMGTVSSELKKIYQEGDPQAVIDNIDWDSFKASLSTVVVNLTSAYSQGSVMAYNEKKSSNKGPKLDLTGPIANQYLEEIKGMISELVEATKRGTFAVTERLMEEGQGANTAVPLILALLGLTKDPAYSLLNTRKAQLVNGNPAKAVKETLEKQAEKALLNRSTLIGENESFGAVSRGRSDTWEQWLVAGFIAFQSKKQWVTRADEFVCQVCGPLHLVTTLVGSPYPGGLYTTPAHPRCRCHERLI